MPIRMLQVKNRNYRILISLAYMALALAGTLRSFAHESGEEKVRTYAQVENLVRKNSIKNVEQFLQHLDQDLLKNYSLIVASRSEQGASFERPRVNLYDPQGQIFLTVTGESYQKNGDTVEVMTFNDRSAQFEFGQINFSGSNPKFTRPSNSNQCMKCHSSGRLDAEFTKKIAHPIWDTYPDWPDRFGSSHRPDKNKVGASEVPRSPHIEAALESFKRTAIGHPRYRYLLGVENLTEEILSVKNSQLGDLFLTLNLAKSVALIIQSPKFKKIERAWLAVVNQAQFETVLPGDVKERYLRERQFDERIVIAGQKDYDRRKTERVLQLNEQSPVDPIQVVNIDLKKFAKDSARIRFLLRETGLPPDTFNLTLEKGSYSFTQGGSYLHQSIPTALIWAQQKCSDLLR